MPRKNPQFRELRARMALMGYTGKDLAEEIGMGPHSLCNRLAAQIDWTVPEAIRVCEALDIPTSEIPKYFPPGGIPV